MLTENKNSLIEVKIVKVTKLDMVIEWPYNLSQFDPDSTLILTKH